MQTGLGKGCKGGEANGSPTRMEQGEQQQQQQQRYMPHTVGAWDESLYQTGNQQNPPVPPSTPSSGSRQQAQGGVSAGSPGVGGCGCGGQGCGVPSGSNPGPVGQIPSLNVAGNGFMSQWQNGPQPSQNLFGAYQGVSQFCADPNPCQSSQFGKGGFHGGFQSNVGGCVGGCTPQVQQMGQILSLSQGLSGPQLMTLMQGLQEQLRSQARLVPDTFGQVPTLNPVNAPGVPDLMFGSDGTHNDQGQYVPLDVFSKSEKWLGSPPKPSFESWTNRELEVIGWSQYLLDLSAWAAQASIEFSTEIQQSSRWAGIISWDDLNSVRRSRAMRLHAILKSSLQDHPRTVNLINAFGEGVTLEANGRGLNLSQIGNGFELLRQLTLEYSLRTRNEALALRSQFASKSFVLSAKETSPSSVVTDVIRRVDLESARFSKLLGTLPNSVDAVGLQLTDADLLVVLMRSLPDNVRMYAIHHAVGDSYQSYRDAARRWEQQQRMFVEQLATSTGTKEKKVFEIGDGGAWEQSQGGAEWYNISDEPMIVDAVTGDKCHKCGSRKHTTPNCQVDMSKVKCFRCQEQGHIGANCPKRTNHDSKGYGKSKGDKGKGKQNGGKGVFKGHFDKGKSKGKGKKGKPSKGFGKKGKLNEVSMSDEDWWWYQDDWNWQDNSWSVDQVGWYGSDWEGSWDWSGEAGSSAAHEHQESEPRSDAKPETSPVHNVGSLILHVVSGEPCLDIGRLTLKEGILDGLELSNGGDDLSALRNVPWFCGLKSQHEGCFDRSTNFHEGLVVGDVKNFRSFHVLDEESQQFSFRESFLFSPLLSELSLESDSDWWLIDSGAAVTVVSDAAFGKFGATMHESPDRDRFRAANGSKVTMKGVAEITLGVAMFDEKKNSAVWKRASMHAMVGNTNHNILSTTSLCQSGWSFSQWSDGAELRHVDSGLKVDSVVMHSGCPWVRMTPVNEQMVNAKPKISMVRFHPDVDKHSGLNPLSPAVEAQLEAHRQQGHFPHHPQCTECAKGRAVFQRRRKKHDKVECEVQADFAFISKRGETSEHDTGRNIKVLVMTELLSGCIGFVVVSENKAQVQTAIERWLDSFGLVSQQTSIVLHTDDEVSVGELVGRSSKHYLFQIRRAAPQQHRSIGGAERSVRKLKESLAVLRADLNKQGYDVRYSFEGLRDVVTYLALMNNHFGRVGGTNLSPLETSAGRGLSKPVVSLFGSTVIAEIPDSLRAYSPNETRSIEACYIHPGLGTGAAVEGVLRVQGQMQLRRFYARNIRQVSPLTWNYELCRSVVIPLEAPDAPRPVVRDIPQEDEAPAIEEEVDEDLIRQEVAEELERAFGSSDEAVVEAERPVSLSPEPSPSIAPAEPDQSMVDVEVAGPSRPSGIKRRSEARGVDGGDGGKKRRDGFVFTPGCPSCESGMNAPGIRHSKKCERNQSSVDEKRSEVFSPDALPPVVPEVNAQDGQGQAEAFRGSKRASETGLERLEEEIKSEVEPEVMTIDSIGLCWLDNCEPLQGLTLHDVGSLATSATCPEMFHVDVTSIKFEAGSVHDSEKIWLCDTEVRLWRPSEAVDDTTLTPLDSKLTYEGMKEEVTNMTKCKVGKVLLGSDVDELRRSCKNLRVIPARWVTAFKTESRVRARVVAKDVRSKQSARELGFSSPTPSTEVLHIVLAISATRGWRLRALDVSHAFMHSPLPGGMRIILKLPQSISSIDGQVLYLDLLRSLNGLRDASLHWLTLLKSTISDVGLWTEELEPCCHQGHVYNESGEFAGSVILIAYVDDILMCSSTKQAEELVVQAISRVVPTKTTGQVLSGAQGGGSLQFIGRLIERPPGETCLMMSVSPSYLDSTFSEYQVVKGSGAVPDISVHLEKTDEASQRPLSPEAYTKFRKALGRLLWMAQTRMDLKVWLSLLGSQQANPVSATEAALRAVLRFLKSDSCVVLRFPTRSELVQHESGPLRVFLHMFCDASHAPYRFNKRKGISGQAIFFEKSLIRGISKQQQATSLSSCESELYAMQQTAQDAVSLGKIVSRILFGIGEATQESQVDMRVESDSSSAIQLVKGIDIPKKSRHIEIRLLWLRGYVENGQINLKHHPGITNMSDIFTKCLGSQLFYRHRLALGFEQREFPPEVVSMLLGDFGDVSVSGVNVGRRVAVVEVCCEPGSSLSVVTKKHGHPYVGVVKDMQSDLVLKEVSKIVKGWKDENIWVLVHVSTPCSSGSPLKRFSGDEPTLSDLEWEPIMRSVGGYLKLGSSRSFELPFHNQIWSRDLTRDVLEMGFLSHGCQVFLCQTGMKNREDMPIGKSLGFATSHFPFAKLLHDRFGFCRCKEHASISEVDFAATARYNECLAKAILQGARAAMRDP